MLKLTIHDCKQLEKRRIDAIADAKMNCETLRNFVYYGIPSFIDRIPSFSSSVLAMPIGGGIAIDTKYNNILSNESNEQIITYKMTHLIKNLPEIYKEIFVDVFINCSKKSSYYSNDKKGYLKRKDI